MRVALLVLLVMASPHLAAAQSGKDFRLRTGRDLVSACEPAPGGDGGGPSTQFCDGFILGAGLLYEQLLKADMIEPWACADPIPTLSEIRNTFISWAKKHPDALDEAPMDTFWRAMTDRWPCR